MTVRCKFRCKEVGSVDAGNDVWHRAKFCAVYSDQSAENKEFFKYTPNAELTLDVVTKQHFVPGKEYYVDITEAPVVCEAAK